MDNREKIAFIVNPISGKNRKTNIDRLIEKYLDKNKYEASVLVTEYAGHASELVNECAKKGIKIVVAVGGDGTVNEVASVAHLAGAVLGIIPNGSGNGLARTLKIPMNKAKAIKCLNKSNIKFIDVGVANNRFFFCTCGAGFDARIGHKFAKSEKRGFITYVKTILKEFKSYKPKKFKLKIDGVKIRRRAFLVTVANAGQWGNNAYIAPKSDIDDGKLDVCIFKPFPWYITLFLSIRLFIKNINRSRYIETIQAENVVFRKKKKLKFHIDGEPVKFKGPINIHLIPKALKIIVN